MHEESRIKSPEMDDSPLKRSQLEKWVQSSVNSLTSKYPKLSHIIQSHKTTISSLLEQHCPLAVSACHQLSDLERQVDGFFLILQGDVANKNEVDLLSSEMRVYGDVIANIRKALSQNKTDTLQGQAKESVPSDINPPPNTTNILSFEKFTEVIERFLSNWTPTSKEALSAFNSHFGAPRIMVANKRFHDGLHYLLFDIPKNGFPNRSHFEHFRTVIDALLDQMKESLSGNCEAYAKEYQKRFLLVFAALEKIIQEDCPSQDNENLTSERTIWKSVFKKIYDESHSKYVLDLQMEIKLEEFKQTYIGKLFENEHLQFLAEQKLIFSRLSARITQSEIERFSEDMNESISAVADLLEKYIVPHLGEKIAGEISENYRRMILEARLEIEQQFEWSEQDPNGLAVILDEDKIPTELDEVIDGLEALRASQPTIGHVQLFGIQLHINQKLIIQYPDESTEPFKEIIKTIPPEFMKRYLICKQQYQVDQHSLGTQLPEIISIQNFRKFIANLRDCFVPFERVLLHTNDPCIRRELQFNYDYIDSLESEVQKTFALQVGQTCGKLPKATDALSRDELFQELSSANRKADAICNTAFGLESEVNTGFEEDMNKAIFSHLPEQITCDNDLENVVYWLIGRIESMNRGAYGSSTKFTVDWSREINRIQFEQALDRICKSLNIRVTDTTKLLSSKPTFMHYVGDAAINREELAEELFGEVNKAQARIQSMGLMKIEISDETSGFLNKMQAEEEMSSEIAKLMMGLQPKQRSKRLNKNEKDKLKKEREKKRRKEKNIEKKNQQPVLIEYFESLKKDLAAYLHNWCPENINSEGPLIGICAFLVEYTFQARLALQAAGITSESTLSRVVSKIDEACTPTIQCAFMLLHAQNQANELWREGKIDPAEKLSDRFAEDTLNDISFLPTNEWLNTELLLNIVKSACKEAENILPAQLKLNEAEREPIQREIWRFRRIALAMCEAPINSIESYNNFFGMLGKLLDVIDSENDVHSHDICDFLTKNLLNEKLKIDFQLRRENSIQEIQRLLNASGINTKTPGSAEGFYINFSANLLTQRCQQFFYSCITPRSSCDQIQRIGSFVDSAFQMLLLKITESIKSECSQGGGYISLSELQKCFTSLDNEKLISCLGLPKEVQNRFRAQVLTFITLEFEKSKTATQFFAEHPISDGMSKPMNGIKKEIDLLLDGRNQSELAQLRQTAETRHAETVMTLHTLARNVSFLKTKSPQSKSLQSFLQAIDTLHSSLYSEYIPQSKEEFEKDPIQSLQKIAQELRTQFQNSSDPLLQRRAIEASLYFSDTIMALSGYLSPPDNESHD